MRRLFALLSLVVIAGCSTTQLASEPYETSIRVQGTGTDLQSARNNAFRQAIEQKAGTAINVELESKNGDLTKQEVLHYSSGYIDRYNVIKEDVSSGRASVVLDVWVSTTRIRDRILKTGRQDLIGQLDGRSIAAKIDTGWDERTNGNRLLKEIVDDYPQRAINVGQNGSYKFEYNRDNNAGTLSLEVAVGWNSNYLDALNDALAKVYAVNNSSNHLIAIRKGRLALRGPHYFWIDPEKFQMITQTIGRRPIKVDVSLLDENNKTVYRTCFKPEMTYGRVVLWHYITWNGWDKNWPKYDFRMYDHGVNVIDTLKIPVEKDSDIHRALAKTHKFQYKLGC